MSIKRRKSNSLPLSGSRVLILVGKFKGSEGVCLGGGSDPQKWAISPDSTNSILELEFEKEFALLLDMSGPGENN